VLREIGADDITPQAIIDSLSSKVDEPSFMGHDYTCDRKQFDGLPAMCSPQQILAVMEDRNLTQVGDWVDVGAIYAG
jgi:branched-chain amino acid transport system substrate-binding protein